MPVEVRELIIKATVMQDDAAGGAASAGSSAGSNTSPGEEMIKACVEKVLEILKEKNER